MTAKLIEGNAVAEAIRKDLRERISDLSKKGVRPGLAVIMVGDDPGSAVYVRMKEKECIDLGMRSKTIRLPADTSEAKLLGLIDELNADKLIHGLLVQMPVPKHIDPRKVIMRISPEKDVDGFHPVNVGKMLIGETDGFLPCTPHGIQVLMERHGIETSGRHVVICGRSNIVGKPMAALLMQKGKCADATVTVCHSRTRDMPSITRQADILIVAMGAPNFIKADMVKEGAVVIDVGMNRVADDTSPKGYRLVGDVDFEAVSKKASAITPVPGGVGIMTRIILMVNTVTAAERAKGG
ncbi:MAG: bifunctional methylenetetrahydrofolate dehydrogenase/methenyltetrahydrofolate cyclohydrolase FolD [Euryarchaeota archaeon]|nr:bifunctional methylenetetrahydrofolate dehydrogenase/methenyltetrahydrofolate cyclohydrolase FolD [Euryarchaeota archaeon]